MMKIVEIANLISGTPQFRIKEVANKDTPIYFVIGQAEVERDLNGTISNLVDYSSKKIQTGDAVNTVHSGDILFSLISGVATVVSDAHDGYLYTQNYIKLELTKEIDKKFIVYILNEDSFIRTQLKKGLQGSAVLKYTMNQLRELKLPKFPAIEKQKIIGDIYFSQLKLEKLKRNVAITETTVVMRQLKEGLKNE